MSIKSLPLFTARLSHIMLKLRIHKLRRTGQIRQHKVQIKRHHQHVEPAHAAQKLQPRTFLNLPDRIDKGFHRPSPILSFRYEPGP